MEWFKHDSDASSDARIRKLIMKHGAVGYAVYFHCLELIMSDVGKDNITFELEHDAEIIADNLKITGSGTEAGVDIVNKIMATIIELRLFESSSNRIFCFKLAARLDSSMTSNTAFRKQIQDVKQHLNALSGNSHDTVMIPSWQDHDTVMKEEEQEEEIRNKKENKKENGHDKIMTGSFQSQKFESFSAYNPNHGTLPTFSDSSKPNRKPNITGQRFKEIKEYWKSKPNLPQSKRLDVNTSVDSEVLEIMTVFPNEDIFKAIDNLSKCYDKIDQEKDWKPPTFTHFMKMKHIESWLSPVTMEKYFKTEHKDSYLDEVLEQVRKQKKGD